MKSVDKLRDCTWIGSGKVNEYLDEIEREIAERYMALPVDADGVPIRAGDKLEYASGGWTFTADSLEIDRWGAHVRSNGQSRVQCANCRHVKPRTIEDILASFLTAVGDDDPHYYDEQIAEYAGEIRELMGGDE